jgi:hypothetical protein
MAFELPTLPFPKDPVGTPYIASPDTSGKYTVASGQWFKNTSNLWVPVSATDPLPTSMQTALPAGTNNIGDVDIASALPAGNNLIGQTKVTDGTTVAAVDATTQRLKTDTVLTGSIEMTNTAPVVGVKTVTATAAQIFAGGSVKANRRKMILKNEDTVLRFRVGPSSVTQQNGFPVEPGASVEFQFDPATAVYIYAIAEGASIQVAVMEV